MQRNLVRPSAYFAGLWDGICESEKKRDREKERQRSEKERQRSEKERQRERETERKRDKGVRKREKVGQGKRDKGKKEREKGRVRKARNLPASFLRATHHFVCCRLAHFAYTLSRPKPKVHLGS